MVQDGQIPTMVVGDRVRLAMQLLAWRRVPPDPTVHLEGLRATAADHPDAGSGAHYEVTGTVLWSPATDGWWVLEVAGHPFVVNEGLDPPPLPAVGARVGMHATLEVAFGYEWEGVPIDGEREWVVDAIRVQVRPLPSLVADGTPDQTSERPLQRMDRWGDEPHGYSGTYVLELSRTRR